jgi:hypothetical protein
MRVKIRISRERDEEIICFDCEEGHAWLEEKESRKINNTI